jgi:hypothetical protein
MDSFRQHEQRNESMSAASPADSSVTEAAEDILDALLRVQKEGGLEVHLTTGNIKAIILVSNFTSALNQSFLLCS